MPQEADRPPTVVFRTTAGNRIGFGHLRRCLTLAAEVRARHSQSVIAFWIDGPPEAAVLASADGFTVRQVEADRPTVIRERLAEAPADLAIVDAYDVDAEALAAWRGAAGALAVIDDLADRFLDADLVLNASPGAASLAYRTAEGCQFLLGPHYALLRPAFRQHNPKEAPAIVSRVLITMGGADPHGDTARAVASARRALPAAGLDVVIGPFFGAAAPVEEMARVEMNRIRLHRGLNDLSALMRSADLAISGGGQTLYEMAACGLPAIALRVADNQAGNLAALAAAPTLVTVDSSRLESTVAELASDRDLRQRMSDTGRRLVDGRGAARAAEALLSLPYKRFGHTPQTL